MRRKALACLFILASALSLAACGSSGGGNDTPVTDGDNDTEAVVDGDTDTDTEAEAVVDGDTDTEAEAEAEAEGEQEMDCDGECGDLADSESEAEEEIDGCIRAAGYYAVTGSCNTSYFSMPNAACVMQDEACGVDLAFDAMYYEGSIAGRAFSVSTETDYGTMTCTGTRGETAIDDLACNLPAASVSCTGVATPATLPDTTKLCCNAVTQDCSDATTERCQVIGQEDSNRKLVAACIPNNGSAKVGEICTRTGTEYKDAGRDTCEKGAFCTLSGSPDDNRYCRKYCLSAPDCDLDQGCMSIGSVPNFGYCQKRCDPLGDASECGNSGLNNCVLISVVSGFASDGSMAGFCYKAGTKNPEEACTYANDCTLGHVCYGGKCSRMCNVDTKPCYEGEVCIPLNTVGEDVGACVPTEARK